MADVTVTLYKPIDGHGGEITSITLKEPTARLFFDAEKEPFKVKTTDDGFEFEFHNPTMVRFITAMSGVDDIILGKLSPRDFTRLRYNAASMIMGLSNAANPT